MGGLVSGVSAVLNHDEKIKNNQVYDLTGRPVGPGYRGLAIKNGKKYLFL